MPLYRCPYVYCGTREQFVVTTATFGDAGIVPWGGGGWSNYPASFVDALFLVLSERGQIERERFERDRKRAGG